jgi:hypothetical protein
MFEGKVVLVYLINPPDEFISGIAIFSPQVQDYFGRKFVTGTVPENPDDWTSGLKASVALDQIAHFLEFQNENDFAERNSSALPGIHGKHIQ